MSSQVKTYGLVADVLTGASLVSAGVTAVLYFTRPHQPRKTGLGWEPQLTADAALLRINGVF